MPRLVLPLLRLLALAALLLLEHRRPLRRRVESKRVHVARNLVLGALSGLTVQALERPVVEPLARAVARRRLGLVQRLPLPGWARTLVAVVLLDATLWLWHVLTHRVPWLWRLHAVHHVDLDLDASTAIRFHAAELAASVPWRAAQVALIGADPATLHLWQRLTLASILFHHADVRLPAGLERWLVRAIVTPRMHGIHHADVRERTDSNWSSGLTLWDALAGTLRLDVPQDEVVIGVPAWPAPEDVTLPRVLGQPLRTQPPDGGWAG